MTKSPTDPPLSMILLLGARVEPIDNRDGMVTTHANSSSEEDRSTYAGSLIDREFID